MSIGDIIGVPRESIPALESAAVARLLAKTIAERDRARELAARLEHIIHAAHELMWQALEEPTSHAEAERVGFEIAAHLQEFAMVSMGGAS